MKKILLACVAVVSMVQLCAQGFNWSNPPTTISTTGVDASNPDVVIDGSGNVTAIWIESSTVTTSALPSGGSWSTPSPLSGTGATNPLLGVDTTGNVTAVWLEGGVIKTANQPFGGSWGSASAISDTGASDPALFVDAAGNAVAAWVRNGFIESATQQFGGAWGSVSMLSSAASDNPTVAIGADGTIIAAWHSVVSGTNRILAAVGGIGQAWNTAMTVMTDSYSYNYPAVAVDKDGNSIVLFFSYKQEGSAFSYVYPMASELLAGGSQWSVPSILSTESFRNPVDFMNTIGFDWNNNAIALWTSSSDGQSFNIETAEKPFGMAWASSAALVLQSLYAYQGEFSVLNTGDVSSIYMFSDSGVTMIQSSDTSIGDNVTGYWSVPINVSMGSQNGFPQISTTLISDMINGAAVWVYNDGSNNLIVASTGMRAIVAPPTDVLIEQDSVDQGVFVEYYNTISWTASIDPNLQGYNIFRNGIYWTQVDSGTLSIVDHNAVQDGTITYGVAAINSSLEQSAIETATFP